MDMITINDPYKSQEFKLANKLLKGTCFDKLPDEIILMISDLIFLH